MANDLTVRVFNNFYNLDLSVGADQYEVVYSFFRARTSSDATARSFTETLFRVSNITDTPVLELLQGMENQNEMQIQLSLAYYLNTLSNTKSVLFGASSVMTPNPKVQRNIIQ